MLFNPCFEICSLCFLVVLMLYYFRRHNIMDSSGVLYAAIMFVAAANICCDVASAYTLTYAAQVPLWLNMVLIQLYLITQLTLSVLFMLYAMALVNYPLYEKQKRLLVLIAPALLLFIFICLSPVHDLIICFDQALNYTHGSLFNIIYLLCFSYMGCGLFVVIRYRQRVVRLQLFTIIAYVLITAAAIAFQYLYPWYLLSGMAVTIAILMMYLTFQNPENYSDKLTGLYAVQAFQLSLDKLISLRQEYGLIVIELKNLKFINTAYGIPGGNALLVQIGSFLSNAFGLNNTFRIKGDRFAVIYTHRSKADGEKVQERFNHSWQFAGSEAVIPVSICRIPISQYASTRDDAIAIMDSAILMLKTMDKGAYLDIDRQTANILYRRMAVEAALRYAIDHRTLTVYFQPIYLTATAEIIGAEALVRLYDTKLGNIPPDEFIIVAEQMGLIKEVGEIVIEITSKFVADNRLWERGVNMIHINLSTLQCMEYKLAEHILAIFERVGVPASMFSFEITESAAIASESQLLNTMHELIPHGVKFAMDDYGSGYSNSSSIIQFPFHAIKIDKSMLWNSASNAKARVIFDSTVGMIQRMNLTVIAEGAETKEHIDMLKQLGVDCVQGFYYSKPLPSEKFLQYLERYTGG